MIPTDNETKVDLLNNETIATTIAGLLRANGRGNIEFYGVLNRKK